MSFSTAARSSVRVALVLSVALLAALGMTGTAHAHATLIGSDPAEGMVLSAAPTVVKLTFDDSLENFAPTVVVTGPDGNQYQSGPPIVDGSQLSSAVAPLAVPGPYTIAYRVVSHDGHPVEGAVHFQLAATGAPASPTSTTAVPSASTPVATARPASPSPTATPTVTSSADTAAAASSAGGWSSWQWVLVALFVVLALLATMIVRRRMAASARARSDGPGDGNSRPG